MGIIRSTDLAEAMAVTPRQYLMGDLGRPQELEHLHSERAEVGLVEYPEPHAETPHVHPRLGEYLYTLAGRVLMMDLDTRDVQELRAGDFLAIEPGVPHVQKSAAGTRILFFKVPSGNDKVVVDVDDDVAAWMADLDL